MGDKILSYFRETTLPAGNLGIGLQSIPILQLSQQQNLFSVLNISGTSWHVQLSQSNIPTSFQIHCDVPPTFAIVHCEKANFAHSWWFQLVKTARLIFFEGKQAFTYLVNIGRKLENNLWTWHICLSFDFLLPGRFPMILGRRLAIPYTLAVGIATQIKAQKGWNNSPASVTDWHTMSKQCLNRTVCTCTGQICEFVAIFR